MGAWPGSGFGSATKTWNASPRSSARATGRLSTPSRAGESPSFRPAHGRRPAFHAGGPEADGTRSDPWLEQAPVKYLVIGATGNIGSRVTQRLVHAEHARPFSCAARRRPKPFSVTMSISIPETSKGRSLAGDRAGRGRRDIPRDGWMGSREARSGGLVRCPPRWRTTGGQALSLDVRTGIGTGPWHSRGEDAVRESGVAFTFIQAAGFMSNALGWSESIRERACCARLQAKARSRSSIQTTSPPSPSRP